MPNFIKVFLINIVLFFVLESLSILSAFLSGYAAAGQENRAWGVFTGFAVFHLFLNFFLVRKFRLPSLTHIILTFVEILALYGIAIWTMYH
jgi:hypothetical protein